LNHLIWITGLPNAGKTTIANKLTVECGLMFNQIPISLDGDALRRILNMDHITTDLERVKLGLTYVKLATDLVDQGHIVIVSAVAMYKEIFLTLAENIVPTSTFYIEAKREIRLERDNKKGIYKDRDLSIENLVDSLPENICRVPNNSDDDLDIAIGIILEDVLKKGFK
jgi:adenylylsulfate kinase-like enzyme